MINLISYILLKLTNLKKISKTSSQQLLNSLTLTLPEKIKLRAKPWTHSSHTQAGSAVSFQQHHQPQRLPAELLPTQAISWALQMDLGRAIHNSFCLVPQLWQLSIRGKEGNKKLQTLWAAIRYICFPHALLTLWRGKTAAFICILNTQVNSIFHHICWKKMMKLILLFPNRWTEYLIKSFTERPCLLLMNFTCFFLISTVSTKKYKTIYYKDRSFSFHAHQTLLSCTKKTEIPPSSHYSKLTYIMCLERRFFNRGSEAPSHAVQDSTDQWPSAAHRPPPWHHTFHNTAPKDAHTKRTWSFDLCLFVQRKLVFLFLFW